MSAAADATTAAAFCSLCFVFFFCLFVVWACFFYFPTRHPPPTLSVFGFACVGARGMDVSTRCDGEFPEVLLCVVLRGEQSAPEPRRKGGRSRSGEGMFIKRLTRRFFVFPAFGTCRSIPCEDLSFPGLLSSQRTKELGLVLALRLASRFRSNLSSTSCSASSTPHSSAARRAYLAVLRVWIL